MKRFLPLLLACGVAVGAFAQTGTFTLKSADIAPGATIKPEQVASGNGCTGSNVSPALDWTGAPAGTKSFALILHDPDAPTGVGGFTHWIVYNIPANTSSIAKGAGTAGNGALPAGTLQANNSGGAPAYGGPCPPVGDKPHQYVFTLYALKTDKLDLPANATQAIAGFTINANAIGKATFSGYYGR
jgi:Raf kinase inhibitor-like YbhB/YbcL family protein